ncbi:amidohydrolase family protein [Paenibacillus hamazuiensis]|uniref:amidohydrolase family protein n=1 Tax=Paenibacillus hamazuiensis TaxID=2936508 RepID=UPI0020105CE8|nr:amidohydrolase family protein [Paenibacillus hamazuiensis]
MYDLVFRNARLHGAPGLPAADIAVSGGTIVAVGSVPEGAGLREIDASGLMALPPFVESHIHLDTVLTAGDPSPNASGTLFEGIRLWQQRKRRLTREDVLQRAEKVIRRLAAGGVLHIRSQADISDPQLTALRALLELRERVKPQVNLQVIAFPQDGIVSCPDNRHRLEEALRLGADGIGAIPHCEHTREDGIASLRFAFELAEKYGSFIHVFCDELDDPHSRYLEAVAAMALASGLRERVTAAHASATGYYGEAYFQKLLGQLSASGIHIVCCPLIGSAMQGRFDGYPKGRGIARIKELWQAGVNVSVAHDDIRTPFYPLGSGSMLQAAHMAVHLAHMTGAEELEEAVRMVTVRAAKVLQIESRYGLETGKPASFVLLPAADTAELLSVQPPCRFVVSGGTVLAETSRPETVWREDFLG